MIINPYIFETSYPTSLKLFIDAGNSSSYPGSGSTVYDLVGNQNGTLINGVGYSSSDGGYFTFNGVNHYIDLGINTVIQPTTERTVSVWVYVSANGAIFSDYTVSTLRDGILLHRDLAGGKSFLFGSSGFQSINQILSLNTWYYVTFKFDGSNITNYINGVLNNTSAQTQTLINGVNRTTLGDSYPTDFPLNGRISQCKIYDVALSDADVLTDFNEFKSRYGY